LGDTLTYYFGGQWSKWSDGEQTLAQDDEWWQVIVESIKLKD